MLTVVFYHSECFVLSELETIPYVLHFTLVSVVTGGWIHILAGSVDSVTYATESCKMMFLMQITTYLQ